MEPISDRDFFIKEGADKLKAEETAQQTETRMRMAMAAARQGFFEIDIRTDNVVVSPGYVRMIGYEPEEFPGKWFDLIHPDDLNTARLIYNEYITGRRDDCRSEFQPADKVRSMDMGFFGCRCRRMEQRWHPDPHVRDIHGHH